MRGKRRDTRDRGRRKSYWGSYPVWHPHHNRDEVERQFAAVMARKNPFLGH